MTTTPAGFYPDGNGATRWWDGAAWSSHTQDAPAAIDEPDEPGDRGRVAWIVALVLLVALIVIGAILFARAARSPKVVANCDLVASQAVSFSRATGAQPTLVQLTGPVLVRNDTRSYAPPTDAKPSLIYSCQGLGSYSDGTQATTLVRMTLGTNGSYQVTSANAVGAAQ